jgi:hypothetical protein
VPSRSNQFGEERSGHEGCDVISQKYQDIGQRETLIRILEGAEHGALYLLTVMVPIWTVAPAEVLGLDSGTDPEHGSLIEKEDRFWVCA